MTPTTTDRGRMFENRVASLFRLLGCQVRQDVLVAGRQIDLAVEDQRGFISRQYIVECKDQARPVNSQQFDSFLGRLNATRAELGPNVGGIMVSTSGYVKEIRAQATKLDITLKTISELEHSLVDFEPYLNALKRQLASDEVIGFFIEPRLRLQGRSIGEPAFEVLERWLLDPELNQLTLLGDYGTGKTTLLRRWTARLLKRHEDLTLNQGGRSRVPVYIDLRQYTQAISLKQIVLDLLDTYGVRTPSYATFEYLLRDGHLVLMLDGFDEMASRGNFETTIRNFRELIKSALGNSKIVLSSRTHYFAAGEEIARLHGADHGRARAEEYTKLYREVAARSNFHIVYMEDFQEEQVEQYLLARCRANAPRVRAFIRNTFDLKELSRRPVLLDMIVASEGRLTTSGVAREAISPGLLYQIYVDIWLSENDWSTFLSVREKSDLLELFASRAELEPDYRLDRMTIPELVEEWRTDLDSKAVDAIERELRTASFLIRQGERNFRFSHRSFQDFFYARHLVAEAERNCSSAWGSRYFRSEVYHFIIDLLKLGESGRQRLTSWVRDPGVTALARVNAAKCLSRSDDGYVRDALVEVARNREEDIKLRRSAVTALGNHSEDQVVSVLIQLLQDGDVHITSNALIALGRMRSPRARDVSLEVIGGTHPAVDFNELSLKWVYQAAAGFFFDEVVRAYISCAPLAGWRRGGGSARLPIYCIELCRVRWSPDAEKYCTNVIMANPDSIRIAGRAFSLLPAELRWSLVPIILPLIAAHRRRGGRVGEYVGNLVEGLRGRGGEHVRELMLSLISGRTGVAPVALEIVAADFPEMLVEYGAAWLSSRPRQNYRFRIRVAELFLAASARDGEEIVRDIVLGRARPALKMPMLDLLFSYFPKSFGGVVERLWETERASASTIYALELLLNADRNRAITLAVERGVTDASIGIRANVCRVLASERTERVTQALLGRLESDSSKWVRLAALKSLLAPGRVVDVQDIDRAMEAETDPAVVALRRELLGA